MTAEPFEYPRSDWPDSVVLAFGFSPDSKRLFAVRADGTVPSWTVPGFAADKEWPLADVIDLVSRLRKGAVLDAVRTQARSTVGAPAWRRKGNRGRVAKT